MKKPKPLPTAPAPEPPATPVPAASAPAPAQRTVDPLAVLRAEVEKLHQQAEQEIVNWTNVRELRRQQLALFNPPAPNRAARRRGAR